MADVRRRAGRHRRPTEVPIWREVLTTPDARRRAGHAGGHVPHGDVGDAWDEYAEACPGKEVADSGQGEWGGRADSAQDEDADGSDDAAGSDHPGGRLAAVDPAGELGHG